MNRKSYGIIRLGAALLLLVITTACITGMVHSAWIVAFQPGPLWIRIAAEATAAGVFVTIILLIATFLFGRFFCAALCPLGVCQDIIGMAGPKRKTAIPNPRWLRYGIAVVSLLLLASGWAVLFRYLDPFSRFAAMAGSVKGIASAGNGTALSSGMIWGALVPLLLLVILVLWKRRIYCVSLCPIGTILGIVAKFSMGHMKIRNSCGGCGRCDAVCPTGCVDSATKSVDAERCVLCMKCASVCPNGSIGYAFVGNTTFQRENEAIVDTSRRKFILAGSMAALGAVVVGRGFSHAFRSVARAAENVRELILPPGAVDSERFARQCTGCQVCTANCPAGIIKPSPYGFGPVRLDYSGNGCDYTCTRCNAVCPSGALRRLDLVDKQWLKIGEARVDLPKCRIVKDGIACGLCVKACPKGAIFMMDGDDGFGVPEVAAFHCIGCGVCQAICPVSPKAITVEAIEQQPMGF